MVDNFPLRFVTTTTKKLQNIYTLLPIFFQAFYILFFGIFFQFYYAYQTMQDVYFKIVLL